MAVLPREMSPEARRNAAGKPWRPRNAVWEVTLACNLRCAHCGSRAGCARRDELSPAEALDVVAQLADLGGELLTLSGGEPLLRPDWDALAREGVRRGLAVNMVTNGTLVDDRAAGRAVEAGLANAGVSIDGPEAIHDAVRGPGVFRATVRGLERLRAAGLPVAVLTTVHRLNLPFLEATRRLALDLGASQIRFQLGKPMGTLKDHDDWVLSPRQVPGLVDMLVRMKEAGGIAVSVGDSVGYCGEADRALRGHGWRGRSEAWHGCQAGLQAVGIESDGGIKGCLSLQARLGEGDRDPFREGGLRDASLAEWWFRPGAFAFNREFRVEDLAGACRACRFAARCRGGAKCVAAAFTGALAEDPYCDTRIRGLEARPGLRESLSRGAVAAAAAAVVAGAPGCEIVTGDDAGGKDVPADVAPADPGAPDVPVFDPGTPDVPGMDPGKDAVDCSQVCCMCDYGVIPDDVWKACCETPVDVILPDPGKPDVPLPQDPGPADVPPPPDAIDCSDVCCMCEYGVIPDEVWKACCETPADAIQPDPGTPDVPPPRDPGPADAKPPADAIDCSDVCCMCDYGVIPDEVWQACCAAPDVPAADAPRDAGVDCAALPCQSDPKSIPAAAYAECCEKPCTPEPCCDCEYGLPPPPQCCQ